MKKPEANSLRPRAVPKPTAALNLIIAGVGGQGNVLASRILGRAAVSRGLQVSIGETFGLSQRGGPVMSHVRISEKEAPGPIIPPNKADFIVGLEPLETLRIVREFANDSTRFIVNTRPIYPLNVIAGDADYPVIETVKSILEKAGRSLYWIPATRKAIELGNPILMNMILLGALTALPDFPVSTDDIKEDVRKLLPEGKYELNCMALKTGKALMDS